MGHTHVPSVDGDGVRDKPLPVPSCSRVPPTGLQALWPEGQEAHAVLSESQAKPLCSNSFGIQRTAKYGALFGYHGNSLFMAAQALVRPVSTEGLPSRDQPTATEDRCVCVCVCVCVVHHLHTVLLPSGGMHTHFHEPTRRKDKVSPSRYMPAAKPAPDVMLPPCVPSGPFYTSRKCRHPAPVAPTLPDLPAPPPKSATPPPTMNSTFSPATGASPRERPRSLMLAGSNLNRRRPSQSSVGNHDNSAVVNVSEDELVNDVSSEQQAATKPDNKVGNAAVDASPVEPAVPQSTLEPLLAAMTGQHLSMVSPNKEGSSSSNGSEDFSRPASGMEPRPTVHSGFELAGQYPSAVVSGGGLPCRGRGVAEGGVSCGISLWLAITPVLFSFPSLPPSLLPPSTLLLLQAPPVYMLNGMQQHPFAHGTTAPSATPLPPAVEFQYQQLMGLHGRSLVWSVFAIKLLHETLLNLPLPSAVIPGALPFLPTGPMPHPPDLNQHLFMVNSIPSQQPFINTHSSTFSGSAHMPKLKEFPPTKQSPPSKRRRVQNKDDGTLPESLRVHDRPPGYPQRTSTQGRQSVT